MHVPLGRLAGLKRGNSGGSSSATRGATTC